MAKANVELKCNINADKATKQIVKVTECVEKLRVELEKLRSIEIEYSIVEVKKQWWNFWK